MAVSVIPTLDLERAIAEQGYDVIVGFDEVGRGSLAGPVMVGAAAIWARDLDGSARTSQEARKNLRLWKCRKAWPTPKC